MQRNSLRLLGCLSVVAAIVGMTGCSSIMGNKNDGRSASQKMNDSRITSQVKDKLNNEVVYKFNGVDVKTYGGTVQLSGFVDTEQQKSRAGEIAQQVPGVDRVENAITLKPEPSVSPTGRTNGVPQNATTNSVPIVR